jgi:COP9 signalosome complex subunit 4
MALVKKLDNIAALDNKEDKKNKYIAVVQEIFESESGSNVKIFIDHITKQNAVVSREVLRQFADAYKGKRKASSGKTLLKSMIESMDTILAENNTKLFEEVVNSLLYNIAKVFQGEMEDDDEDAFEKAARYMGKINLESTNQPYTPAKKCKILIHTAQLYLAEDKYREAEIFVNKCRDHIQAKDIPEMTKLKFWSSMAAVQDANQKYHLAAAGYLRLSEKIVNPKESLEKLEQGMKCTILSPAGPNRARLLAKFYKDERATQLPGAKLVEKMFMERLIAKSDYEAFEGTLAEHQMRLTKEGWTLLRKAVIEHNLIATSKLYNNITMADLAKILEVDADGAENIAASMIAQGRLTGKIDQSKSLLHFVSAHVLQNWDANIESVCNSVNEIFDKITINHPVWVSQQISALTV